MRIAVLAHKEIYPALDGGQVRVAGLISELTHAGHEVQILAPTKRSTSGVSRRLHQVSSLKPSIGWTTMNRGLADRVASMDADVAIAVISYLVPYLDKVSIPLVVDFANVEVDRFRSMAQAASAKEALRWHLEAWKANRWEPKAARRADLALACTRSDDERLDAWGARHVLVPHGVEAGAVSPSPDDSLSVGFLASAGYAPNDQAARWLIDEVWPEVLDVVPGAQLKVFGRGTDTTYRWARGRRGVELLGTVDDLTAAIEDCALMVGPVRSGAGAQLKIITTIGYGRGMVVTPHSYASVPSSADAAVVVADAAGDFAQAISEVLTSPVQRHEMEEAARAVDVSWRSACAPLIDWLEQP